MFHVVLYEPEIPPNTGNIIRLCANTGSTLHLVHPLGFRMEDKLLRRAGLDYHELAGIREHADLDACLSALASDRVFACTTKGATPFTRPAYRPGDVFLFGPESRGLPDSVLAGFAPERRIRIPMCLGNRSLNLSNAVAVVVFEAWRQNGFSADGGSAG